MIASLKTALYWTALILALALISAIAKKGVAEYMNARSEEKLQATLDQAAVLISKSLPTTTAGVRFDRITSPGNKTLVYEYSLVERLASQIDAASEKQKIYPGLLKELCDNPGQKNWFMNGVTNVYLYRDKLGAEVVRVSIAKNDCDNWRRK